MNKPSRQAVPQIKKKTAQSPNAVTEKLDKNKLGNEVIEETSEGTARTYVRNVSGKAKIWSDLYKLLPEIVIKYEGWEKEGKEHPDTHPSKFSHWEHTHPFRTFDKKGSRVTTSVPIGGHFHVVEWEYPKGKDGKEDKSQVPTIKSVSGPMVMGQELVRGRMVKMPVAANQYDEHTHDIEYIRSGEIEFATTNVEAQKVIAFEAMRGGPIAGVSEQDGGSSTT